MATKEKTASLHPIVFSEIRKEWWNISRKYGRALQYLIIYLIISGIYLWLWLLDYALCYILWIQWDTLIPDLFTKILWIIFSIWLLWFTFDLIKWVDAKIKNFWKAMNRDTIWRWVLWMILYGTFVALWCILFIIPWIIVAVRLKFTLYAVLDKWMDPTEAIKYSWNITKWHFREIVRFDIYLSFFNIIWMLCLIVWLVWTVPMTQLAMARYYLSLSEMYESAPKENKVKNKN